MLQYKPFPPFITIFLILILISGMLFSQETSGTSADTASEVNSKIEQPEEQQAPLIKEEFEPFFAMGAYGGYSFRMNQNYYRSLYTDPVTSTVYYQFFPPFFKNHKVLNQLTFIGEIGYMFGRFQTTERSSSHQLNAGIGARYHIPLWKGLFVFASISGGYYFDMYKIDALENEDQRMKQIQGMYGKVITGVGWLFFDRLDFSMGAEYSTRFDGDWNTTFNQNLGMVAGLSFRFEKPKPRITIEEINIPDLFTALTPYYSANNIASIKLVNDTGVDLNQITVGITVPGYMDAPTQLKAATLLQDGKDIDVSMPIVLNSKGMALSNTKTVSVNVQVEYAYKENIYSAEASHSIQLYHAHAMSWDDESKLGSFITPIDPPVLSFANKIANTVSKMDTRRYSTRVFEAMAIYEACAAYGLSYVSDPESPTPGNKAAIDFIKYPRDFLDVKTGDCDDLTVLLCSLWESIGIQSAFVTVPGHIFVMFNTEMSPEEMDFVTAHPEKTYIMNDEVWVPVEATAVGREDFATAWEWAVAQLDRWRGTGGLKVTRTSEAQLIFPPVSLPESENIDISSLDLSAFHATVGSSLDILFAQAAIKSADELLEELEMNPTRIALYKEIVDIYLQDNKLTEAENILEKGVAHAPENISLLVLQVLVYLKQNKEEASKAAIAKLMELAPNNPRVYVLLGYSLMGGFAEIEMMTGLADGENSYDNLLNSAKEYIKQKEYETAKTFLNKCIEIDPRDPRAYIGLGVIMTEQY